MPYRKPRDGTELPPWKQDFNAGRRKVRAHVEHALARLKTYKTLRDYRRAERTLAKGEKGIPSASAQFCWPGSARRDGSRARSCRS